MYVLGSSNTEQLVKSTSNYPLKGKADVIFQNAGTSPVRIGIRMVEPNTSYRFCGELTVLSNPSIAVTFMDTDTSIESRNLWVHYILPTNLNC